MTATVTTGALLTIVLALTGWPAPPVAQGTKPDPKSIERGREVYRQQRCQTCHSIEGAGNRRSPLDGVGDTLKEEDIRRWIVAPREMNPKVRKRPYELPDADLDALVSYLRSLEKKHPQFEAGQMSSIASTLHFSRRSRT